LEDQEVISLYKRRQLPVTFLEPNLISPSSPNKKMVQLVDIFSKPEMSLMAVVKDYFMKHSLQYKQESRYYDVSTSIGAAHVTFHSEKRSNPSLYLHRDPFMIPRLEKLIQANKKIFLITNSHFETVDAGMAFATNTRRQTLVE